MNTMNRLVACLLGVVALVPADADPVESATAPTESFTLNSAMDPEDLPASEPTMCSSRNYLLQSLFSSEEADAFTAAVLYLDAPGVPQNTAGAEIVPEAPSGALVLLGLAVLIIRQRMVPVNLRTVHSRLQARRGHVPIR